MLGVLPPTTITNQFILGCEKFLKNIEISLTFFNKICTCFAFYETTQTCFELKWLKSQLITCMAWLPRNSIQQDVSIHAACNKLICCKIGFELGVVKLATSFFRPFSKLLQFCCPFYHNFKNCSEEQWFAQFILSVRWTQELNDTVIMFKNLHSTWPRADFSCKCGIDGLFLSILRFFHLGPSV